MSRSGRSASSRSRRAERGQRHLGGGDGPQVVALEVVRVVDELGQVAVDTIVSVRTRVGGRISLEGVGVAVEGGLAEGPGQGGAHAPVEGEHRAESFAPAHVEQAERLTDLPVRSRWCSP